MTYNLVEISAGRFRGMIHSVEPCNNSEIGSLKHDVCTYWGHSGASLNKADDGKLIELHSSWNEKTPMRHGVPLQAIIHFLSDTLSQVDTPDADAKKSLALLCVRKDKPIQRRSIRKTATLTKSSPTIIIDDEA